MSGAHFYLLYISSIMCTSNDVVPPSIRMVGKLFVLRYVTAWLPGSNLSFVLHASQDMVNISVSRGIVHDEPTDCHELCGRLHRVPMLFQLNGRPPRAPCAVRDNVVLAVMRQWATV